ncbi:hypothetical protein BDA99DRAFT_541394 [Phascolomyces articulosus]|uniref:Uncharacterized protein n=1 Tax=Phascolomyces articulosus TaxID=60185 RepID=A0AAD5P9N6_9FUNG|nr:hypothetical protein BDA99DRAFT_541394 [Phascolomyces articulosus]
MEIIHQSCPNLNSLVYDHYSSDKRIYKHDDTNEKEDGKTDTPATAATSGNIREISVKIQNPRDIIPIFFKNSNTIQTLGLDASFDDEIEVDNSDWDSLTNVCSLLSNLRSPSLCGPYVIHPMATPSLFQNAINLRWLHLSDGEFSSLSTEVFRSIGNLPLLQKLVLERCYIEDQDLVALFNTLIDKGRNNQPTLEDVRLVDVSHVSDIMDHLSAIPTIKNIILESLDDIIDDDIFQLAEDLYTHPGIRSITLESLECYTSDMVLSELSNIEVLEQLHLISLSKLSRIGLENFNGGSVKLVVEGCEFAEDQVYEYCY